MMKHTHRQTSIIIITMTYVLHGVAGQVCLVEPWLQNTVFVEELVCCARAEQRILVCAVCVKVGIVESCCHTIAVSTATVSVSLRGVCCCVCRIRCRRKDGGGLLPAGHLPHSILCAM